MSHRKLRRRVNRSQRQLRRNQEEALRVLPFYKDQAQLLATAVDQAKRSKHYGGYQVGAAGYGRRANGSICLLVGANAKAAPGLRQACDHCAEEVLEQQAIDQHCVEIIGIVVVSPRKIDDGTGLNFPVNMSCWYCRRRYERILGDPTVAQKHPIKPNTQMIYADLNDLSNVFPLSIHEMLALFRARDELRKLAGDLPC